MPVEPFPDLPENKSDTAVTVRLRMAGFYELIPGQAGQTVRE